MLSVKILGLGFVRNRGEVTQVIILASIEDELEVLSYVIKK